MNERTRFTKIRTSFPSRIQFQLIIFSFLRTLETNFRGVNFDVESEEIFMNNYCLRNKYFELLRTAIFYYDFK